MNVIVDQDLQYVWHPCAQMKDYAYFRPLLIKSASGSYIELSNGKKLIDATSSWWCKSLGHNHPRLQQAIAQQIKQFEHVMFAHTTNDVIVELSTRLTNLTTSLKKVFYAGDGSSAVEIAMKMSLHSRIVHGESKKIKFIALENAYHGETTGALSVSDLGLYKNPYKSMLFDVQYITSLPYVQDTSDPLWNDCSAHWETIRKQLESHIETTTAIIVEPIVQGAGGMKIYSQDFLRRLRLWTAEHHIHLIADEIMTGLGRTGKMLACQHANIEPDFLCLSKGLTSGWMAFSAVLTTDDIYQTFYADYDKNTAFLHSHTFSGNALGASVALEVLKIMDELNICDYAQQLGSYMLTAMQEIADNTKKITQVRQIGAIVAADIITTNPTQRFGFELYKKATELGALLRPLGNTIYWLPPLNTNLATIDELKEITNNGVKYLFGVRSYRPGSGLHN